MSRPGDRIRATKTLIAKELLYREKDVNSFILQYIPEQIKKRTQLGYGVGGDGEAQRKLTPGLSDKYKDFRKKNKGDLGDGAKPNKLNLTATGQMLNAIKGRIVGRFQYLFEIKGSRTKELGDREPKLTNKKVANYVQKVEGRKFFFLSKTERLRIEREVRKILMEGFKKLGL